MMLLTSTRPSSRRVFSTFSTWTKLTTLNYPDSLLNTGNACGFPKSYAGTVFSRNYTTPAYSPSGYSASLAAYAGKAIKLRWRISSDSSGTRAGWWVDDIAVTNAVFEEVCSSGTPASPMEAGAAGSPMAAAPAATGTGINLSYGPACGALDNAVYWGVGPIVGSPSWTAAACSLGNTGQASFDPGDPASGTFFYFVIVGQSATAEGSYGLGTFAERPEASGVGGCDKPQDLSGVCP
jgi:hypothetical protein